MTTPLDCSHELTVPIYSQGDKCGCVVAYRCACGLRQAAVAAGVGHAGGHGGGHGGESLATSSVMGSASGGPAESMPRTLFASGGAGRE
jgi:hypothetical protein